MKSFFAGVAIVALCGFAVPAAVTPATASVIDFTGLQGTNGSAFTSFSEAGFVVAPLTGQFLVGTNFGAPVPDLYAGRSATQPTDSLSVVRSGGGDFSFASLDIASSVGTTSYSIFGSLGGATVYTLSGSALKGGFSTIASCNAGLIDQLTVTGTTVTATSFNIDNIVVSAVPEAPSIAVFGAALLGVGLLGMRRKVALTRLNSSPS
jgi:hypothetical protein